MKINRKKLNKALTVQKNIVANRGPIVSLQGVMVSANAGSLEIRGCDGVSQVTTTISGAGSDIAPIVLNFKELSKICKLQKTPDVDIQCCENKSLVDGVTLEAWVKAEEFPSPKSSLEKTTEISGSILRDALEYVLPAASKDCSMRFGLDCVRVDGNKIIATDGHRMHIYENVPLGFTASIARTVALVLIEALKKSETSVCVASKKDAMAFWFDSEGVGYSVATLATDFAFPEYSRALPREAENTFAKVEGSTIEKLERIAKLCKAEKGNPTCRANFNGNLQLDAMNCGNAVFRETVSLNFLKTLNEPVEFTTGFNPQYLIEALAVSNAEIGFKDAYSPLIIRAESTYAVVMPVKL